MFHSLQFDGAGMAADAGVEIDDEAELLRPAAGGRRSLRRASAADLRAVAQNVRRPGRSDGGWAQACGNAVALMPASPARPARSRTRRSYHAACPVIGSALAIPSGRHLSGQSSEIRWLSRKPRRDSGASWSSFQAPARLPIAFQVHTVSGLTPSISRTWHLILPCAALDPDPIVVDEAQRAAVSRCMYRRFWPRIWRSQAFCEPQE